MVNKQLNLKMIEHLRRRDFQSALQMIEAGLVDVNDRFSEPDIGIESPMLTSAVDLGETEVVRRLIALGVDANQSYSGGSPLVNAAGLGHLEIVDLLLKAGASVNARMDCEEETGETALMAAAALK